MNDYDLAPNGPPLGSEPTTTAPLVEAPPKPKRPQTTDLSGGRPPNKVEQLEQLEKALDYQFTPYERVQMMRLPAALMKKIAKKAEDIREWGMERGR